MSAAMINSNGTSNLPDFTDAVEVARLAGLRYVSDTGPGIRRKRCGRGFSYIDVNGKLIRDPEERQRLEALAIPPAWKDVWICPRPDGHIQATGRDEKGRKQYRYHLLWRRQRSQTKYDRMYNFGQALPMIRQRVDADLARRSLSREKVLATVVRLLETTLIRVGNKAYARENGSFGLTTMRDRHADISGADIQFHFRGKSGLVHTISVHDRRLARIVKKCRDISGYELFQYFDENGRRQVVDSSDVNTYLREISEQDFTAKDFRTWGGSVLTLSALQEIGPFESETQAKKNVVQSIKETAAHLGNRPATCRNYYVHPAVIDSYMTGRLLPLLHEQASQPVDDSPYTLSPHESIFMRVLQGYLESA